jgi:uncharacterized protein (TIGR02001 family)
MLTSVRGLFAATVFAASGLLAVPAYADETDPPPAVTVTGNVALTTDYRFRGVSYTGNDPAIQGGITASHSSGFYIGTWSSSIKDSPVYGEQELDLFAGWTGKLSEGLTFDAGLLMYAYPSGKVGHGDYFEPYAAITTTLGPATAKFGAAYAWSQKSLGNDDNLYLFTNVDFGIPETPVTINTHVGYTSGVLSPDVLAGGTDKSELDWLIGATAKVYGPLSVSVSYVGVGGKKVKGLTDDGIVATLTAAF